MILRSKYFSLKRPPRLISTYVYLLNYKSISISILLLILSLSANSSNVDDDSGDNSTVEFMTNDTWDVVYTPPPLETGNFPSQNLTTYGMKRARHKNDPAGSENATVDHQPENSAKARAGKPTDQIADKRHGNDTFFNCTSENPTTQVETEKVTTPAFELATQTSRDVTNKSKRDGYEPSRSKSEKSLSTLLTPLDLTPLISKVKGKERLKSNKITLQKKESVANYASPHVASEIKTTSEIPTGQIESYSIDVHLKGVPQSDNLHFNDTDRDGGCDESGNCSQGVVAFLLEKPREFSDAHTTSDYAWETTAVTEQFEAEIDLDFSSADDRISTTYAYYDDIINNATMERDESEAPTTDPFGEFNASMEPTLPSSFTLGKFDFIPSTVNPRPAEVQVKKNFNVSDDLWPVKLASVVEGDIILGGLMMVSDLPFPRIELIKTFAPEALVGSMLGV